MNTLAYNRYAALDAHNWEDYIPPPMGKAATDDFQKRLNELAGCEPDGGPRLKLAWAPDCEEWNIYHKRPMLPQWAFWKAVPDGLAPAYEGSVVLIPKWRYVAAPRYAILGRVPPESRWGDTRDRSFYEKGEAFVDEDGTPSACFFEALDEWGLGDWPRLFRQWRRRTAHLPARATVVRAFDAYRPFRRSKRSSAYRFNSTWTW